MRTLNYVFLIILGASVVLDVSAKPSATSSSIDSTMHDGLKAYQRGDFTKAIELWNIAVAQSINANNSNAQAEAMWRQAEAHRALGQHAEAIKILETATNVYGKDKKDNLSVNILTSYADSLGQSGFFANASINMARAIELARELNNQNALSIVLNNNGNLLSSQARYKEALAAYQESIEVAGQIGNAELGIKALSNSARLHKQLGNKKQAVNHLLAAINSRDNLPASHAKAYSLIGMGQLAWEFHQSAGAENTDWLHHAYSLNNEADILAGKLGDLRAESYAAGYQGEIYASQGRDQEALLLTARAIFAAQQADASEAAYLWHWQAGKLHKKTGNLDAAIAAYRLAVEHVQSIRTQLSTKTAFKSVLGPIFFELTDLLLQRPSASDDKQKVEEYLLEARQTMEMLKAAELQDYFQDNCVTKLQSRTTGLDKIDTRTAVLYPIILEDRMEILLSLSDGMERIIIPVGRKEIKGLINRFRIMLEKRTTFQYMRYAKELYNLMIKPMEPMLESHNIDTLVMVPDAALRTIPIAALHDGKQFLVAKYALASTPGLTLTDPKPLKRGNLNVLVAGLTDAVQGFPPLPSVSIEIDEIKKSYRSTVLFNKDFKVAALEKELSQKQFDIVHIASHAQFSSKPEDTFLLAYDEKFTMDRLESLIQQTKFRDEPVELITLSACQTAAGDERAALGLAGIAIKAGARSALATLWFINDQASSLLVSEFYRQLKDEKLSKAKALQQAQLILMKDKRYRHASYWSPFLLIGNWL